MYIRVVQGTGGHDRYALLDAWLLAQLRQYQSNPVLRTHIATTTTVHLHFDAATRAAVAREVLGPGDRSHGGDKPGP